MSNPEEEPDETSAGTQRRLAVMASALGTFARFGYRKTSMEQIAQAANISRPGLYLLFSSKEELFRAAVTQSLERDLAEVEQIFRLPDQALAQKLLSAFDCWAGSYVGPGSDDITTVIDDNPEILGDLLVTAPGRFSDLVVESIAADAVGSDRTDAIAIAQTLISASIGIKHHVDDRSAYVARMTTAIGLLLG